MISDVLSDAKEEIERYLTDPVFFDTYSEPGLRNRLNDLIAKMEEIMIELDTPPDITTIKEEESLKRVAADLLQKIEERCKKADVEHRLVKVYESHNTNEGIEISLQDGRNKRKVIIEHIFQARELLEISFEKYCFLSGYKAICCYEQNYIEAIITPLENASTFFYLWNLDEREFNSEVTQTVPGKSNITISISPISEQAKILLGDGLNISGVSLKINGLEISEHDEALNCLKAYANSIFFQLDLTREIPLLLARTRFQKQTISSWYPESIELEYPKCKYDEESISLYWYAKSANRMPLLQYLAYYQIIEFYFPLYSQIKAKNTIQNILKSPGFNVHNDSEIIKLLNIARSGLGQGAGSERIQLDATLQECLNISLLKEFLNENQERKEFFKKKEKVLTLEGLATEQADDILRKSVANRIYDIRCRIVHTKTENDFEKARSIYPFTQEANLLTHDISLINYIAKQVLIASSSEFKH
jgi:hypothetical protein